MAKGTQVREHERSGYRGWGLPPMISLDFAFTTIVELACGSVYRNREQTRERKTPEPKTEHS